MTDERGTLGSRPEEDANGARETEERNKAVVTLRCQVVAMDRFEDGRIVQHNPEAGFARAIFEARH